MEKWIDTYLLLSSSPFAFVQPAGYEGGHSASSSICGNGKQRHLIPRLHLSHAVVGNLYLHHSCGRPGKQAGVHAFSFPYSRHAKGRRRGLDLEPLRKSCRPGLSDPQTGWSASDGLMSMGHRPEPQHSDFGSKVHRFMPPGARVAPPDLLIQLGRHGPPVFSVITEHQNRPNQ